MSYDNVGVPMVLPALTEAADAREAMALQRVMLGSGNHNEAWLQQLMHEHPQILPITAIEPAFHDALPVACEIASGHGYIDNILITPRGQIVLAEAKLWKNPQARREMIAQILDYIAALMAMDYAAFEAALAKGSPSRLITSLYDLVREHPDALDEAAFIDAVGDNLARGRILALGVGDGIRHEAKALADLLQSHAGAHFTFALVALGIWQHPATGELICVPDRQAQTVMIERGIVVIEQGKALIKPVPIGKTTPGKPQTITSELFRESLAKVDPALPHALEAFVKLIAPLGVEAVQKTSLILRADVGGAKPVNLGVIDKEGRLWTDYVKTSAPPAAALRYYEQLARLLNGHVINPESPKLITGAKAAPLLTALLPQYAKEWAGIIENLLHDAAEQSGELGQ